MADRHFIAYHNPERMGFPYNHSCTEPHLFLTDKSVKNLLNSTVWVVTYSKPWRDYSLAGVFKVTETGRLGQGEFANFIKGNGPRFLPMIEIWQLSWFGRLLDLAGNLRFCFQAINDRVVISGLKSFPTRT